jgi:hypothetical protein
MNLSQVVGYLGTPAQVSVGMSERVYRGEFAGADVSVEAATRVLVPTYFQDDSDVNSLDYRAWLDVEAGFTTNSVFADVIDNNGLWGLLLALFSACMASTVAGHFSRYSNYAAAIAAVCTYGFLEWWRVYLFNAGIIHFLCLIVLVGALVGITIREYRPFSPKAMESP